MKLILYIKGYVKYAMKGYYIFKIKQLKEMTLIVKTGK